MKKLLIILCLLITFIPFSAFAAEQSEEEMPVNTVITGWKTKVELVSRKKAKLNISVNCPAHRLLYLETYDKGWKKARTLQLADRTTNQSFVLNFPNTWWKKDKTIWRLRIDKNEKATALISPSLTLITKRYYQNPSKWIQIKNKISTHGKNYWTYPVQVNNASTRNNHVFAMINTAKKYLRNPYKVGQSGKPGKGIDCSGLVMQACYAAGVDLWPSNPYRHKFPKYEYESRNIAKMNTLKTVSYNNKKKGDLVFYSRGGKVIHVAIYIGDGKVIHAYPPKVQISKAANSKYGKISKVKRIFVK